MTPDIRIYRRKNILTGDVNIFQADIVSQSSMNGFDHHGIGKTPAEALFNASLHWHENEKELS